MERSRTLTISQWRQLCQEGAAPTVRITLHGSSMHPLIRIDRDYVTVAPVFRPLKRGDIVLFFRADGQYVVHRLRRLQGDTVQTLGDGCLYPDAPMSVDAVCGLVTAMERGKRHIGLDTPLSRWLGCGWMAVLPMRRLSRRILTGIRRCLHGRA